MTPVERFMGGVDVNAGCWQWRRATDPTGYGRFWLRGRMEYAHRAAYMLLVGPIGAGLDLDHLCRNRACVNPAHLEPVSRRTNLLRGATLARAHYRREDCGFQRCRACRRLRRAS